MAIGFRCLVNERAALMVWLVAELSSPVVGSSRIRTSTLLTSSRAIDSLFLCPPLHLRQRLLRHISRPNFLIRLSDMLLWLTNCRSALRRRDAKISDSLTVKKSKRWSNCSTKPTLNDSLPATRISPESPIVRLPARHSRRVDLPAPDGPINATNCFQLASGGMVRRRTNLSAAERAADAIQNRPKLVFVFGNEKRLRE